MNAPNFDTKKFIAEVKRRPAIYDMNCVQYNDRNIKSNAWVEVCRAMIPDWENMGTEERVAEEKSLRNKWRNVRDYFMKELKLNAAGKSKSRNAKKSKRYAFYNQLMFLMPNVRGKKGRKNAAQIQRYKAELEHVEIQIDDSNNPVDEYNLTAVSLVSEPGADRLYQHQSAACEASLAPFENEVPGDVLSPGNGSQRNDEDDYDKMFLLSLLPSFRSVPEHMKLHVRIQMQQVAAQPYRVFILAVDKVHDFRIDGW